MDNCLRGLILLIMSGVQLAEGDNSVIIVNSESCAATRGVEYG